MEFLRSRRRLRCHNDGFEGRRCTWLRNGLRRELFDGWRDNGRRGALGALRRSSGRGSECEDADQNLVMPRLQRVEESSRKCGNVLHADKRRLEGVRVVTERSEAGQTRTAFQRVQAAQQNFQMDLVLRCNAPFVHALVDRLEQLLGLLEENSQDLGVGICR